MLMMTRDNQIEPRPDRCYFVMRAEPNRELTAQANLILRQVPFYLPTIFRVARISHRHMQQGRPRPDVPIALFPGMIFIAEDVVARMAKLLRNVPGFQERPFLTFGMLPDGSPQFAMIRPLGMAAIQMIESDERRKYFDRKRKAGQSSWTPEIGQDVKFLVDEVLGGLEGKVSEVDDKGRITIFTEIMKRTVRVHVTANQIEPA
jgi:transcription antitermination factor NusG